MELKKTPLKWYSYGRKSFRHTFVPWDLVKGVLSTMRPQARTKSPLPFACTGWMVVKSILSSEVTIKHYMVYMCILVIITFVLFTIFVVYQLHNLSLSTFQLRKSRCPSMNVFYRISSMALVVISSGHWSTPFPFPRHLSGSPGTVQLRKFFVGKESTGKRNDWKQFICPRNTSLNQHY